MLPLAASTPTDPRRIANWRFRQGIERTSDKQDSWIAIAEERPRIRQLILEEDKPSKSGTEAEIAKINESTVALCRPEAPVLKSRRNLILEIYSRRATYATLKASVPLLRDRGGKAPVMVYRNVTHMENFRLKVLTQAWNSFVWNRNIVEYNIYKFYILMNF